MRKSPKAVLRSVVLWGLFGLPLTMMVAFGFVVLVPFFGLLGWLDDEPAPFEAAWREIMDAAHEIYGSLSTPH